MSAYDVHMIIDHCRSENSFPYQTYKCLSNKAYRLFSVTTRGATPHGRAHDTSNFKGGPVRSTGSSMRCATTVPRSGAGGAAAGGLGAAGPQWGPGAKPLVGV